MSTYEASTLTLLQQIGIAAGVGGGISAFVNYVLNIKKAKNDREAELIQNKLNAYSTMIYYLDELLKITKKPEEGSGIMPSLYKPKLLGILESLDSAVKDRFYLQNYTQVLRFNEIKELVNKQDYVNASNKIEELRENLRNDYNNKIIKNYEAIVAKGEIDKIPELYTCEKCKRAFSKRADLSKHSMNLKFCNI